MPLLLSAVYSYWLGFDPSEILEFSEDARGEP